MYRLFNLGSYSDALAIIYKINKAYDEKYEKITLIGYCCGGCAIIHALHMLNFPQKYKNVWKQLKIKPNKTKKLLSKVSKVNLVHAWIDKTFSIKKGVKEMISTKLQSPIIIDLIKYIYEGCFTILTDYNMFSPNQAKLLKEIIKTEKTVMDVYYYDKDKIVGNKYIKELESVALNAKKNIKGRKITQFFTSDDDIKKTIASIHNPKQKNTYEKNKHLAINCTINRLTQEASKA